MDDTDEGAREVTYVVPLMASGSGVVDSSARGKGKGSSSGYPRFIGAAPAPAPAPALAIALIPVLGADVDDGGGDGDSDDDGREASNCDADFWGPRAVRGKNCEPSAASLDEVDR